jgi:DNA-binding CsgD family transcriptional regulator
MATDAQAPLQEARAALGRGEWVAARAAFDACLADGETPAALAGLGDALWWLGDTEGAVRCAERAYAGFRRQGDAVSAAIAGVSLYFHFRVSLGNASAARGWLARVARLVGQCELAPLEGWVLLMRAHDSGDPAAAERWAREAGELARRFGDADLELCAVSQLGVSLVEMGRLHEGGSLLDEAMAASLGGECESLRTVVYTSCNMITACSQVAEVERASQWIHAADEFVRQYGSPHLYTTCRTYYAGMLFAAGQWGEAERQLAAALETARQAERSLYAEALARLAELRLAQGRIEEAERLLAGFESHHATATATAGVRLAQGDLAGAESVLHRRLREIERHIRPTPFPIGAGSCLDLASALELLALIQAQRGAVGTARETVGRLAQLSEQMGCEAIVARADRALGRTLAATGDRDAAAATLERSLGLFAGLELPLEAARARLLLARTLKDGEAAAGEAGAALETFEELGAGRDADEAAAFLRSLGVAAARSGPRDAGVLTKREVEVLELLAEGLSNRELAERLFLTRKTVEHHVHSVLSKLGLRSRAAAAAYAVRHRERDSAAI